MSPQFRTLLVVLFLSLGGLTVLSLMASRYGKILDGQAGHPPDARSEVEAFIEVRRAMRTALDGASGSRTERGAQARRVRDRLLDAGEMPRESYERVREHYRAWRSGRSAARGPYGPAFRDLVERLRAVDLGDYEPLDS